MSSKGSVTSWLDRLRAGDEDGAQRLWQDYFHRLVGLARGKLVARPRALDGPEDVALSAFKSFFLAAKAGRFPRLNDRRDLWQILVMLTARKAIDALRRDRDVFVAEDSSAGLAIDNIVGSEPTPSFAIEVAEQCERLLGLLPSDELRAIALLKLEGYTNEQIAERIERSLATVERKLSLIRETWEAADGHA
jgi:DNA-directed RNA polymerase specialized sigma24 family protein